MNRSKVLGALILLLLLTLFFHDILFLGRSLSTSSLIPGTTPSGPYGFAGHKPRLPFSFDIAGNAWVNEPNPLIVQRVLREATVPAWNPYEGLGMPLIANLNTEVFNPLKLAVNLSPSALFEDLFLLARLFVMGLFTYLFLKEMNLSQMASLMGGAFFMLSGYSVWWVNLHPLSTVAYLPAVFYFYERWARRGDGGSPFLMSLCLCFSIVSGKIPDVIMGLSLLFLYALWKGFQAAGLRGLCREGVKVLAITVSGALMASVALVPFLELYGHASPLAKAIRTGAASHTLPLITSVTLFQPLLLGWGNYVYASWLAWSPNLALPHAGLVTVALAFYCLLRRGLLLRVLPFFLFSLSLFCIVYGLLPAHLISRVPIIGSIEFLKYNAMLYLSLAVMAAHGFDDLLNAGSGRKRFYAALGAVSVIAIGSVAFLWRQCPQETKGYLGLVSAGSLSALLLMGMIYSFLRKRPLPFGGVLFSILILELFLYMPKDHPDRDNPYREPPYLHMLKGREPYRITGSGSALPPLVSNALGLYDVRGINVLLPKDYYIFLEHLVSFSVPGTNNPSPLLSAASPWSDLLGLKYILSTELLDAGRLEEELRFHVRSLRWIRLFEGMVSHTIKGGAAYGFFKTGGQERFSFFFPPRFRFETKIRVVEPFLCAGFAKRDIPQGTVAPIKMSVDGKETEVTLGDRDGWSDTWLDLSEYRGRTVTLSLEGTGSVQGNVVLGDFGFSPGPEEERKLYDTLLMRYRAEVPFIEYRGAFNGIHLYENRNVMERAFVVPETKAAGDLSDTIRELRSGLDFRRVGLIPGPMIRERGLPGGTGDGRVVIKSYSPNEIVLQAASRGLLVLSDLYYPGWRVTVNGKEEEVIRVFGLLRGVFLDEGKSEIVFSYRPLSLSGGAVLSTATFLFWACLLWYRRKGGNRE